MMVDNTSAFSTGAIWLAINWQEVERQVKQIQVRIAKAIKNKRFNKAKALQWLLTHSYSAKLLAIRKVTQNKGSKTSGVDRVLWRTSRQKMEAVKQLTRNGYHALPLRRIYIPKNGNPKKLRPLSIPTMKDRAMQTLYLFALEPVSETIADKNAYGFRPKRSCADAIEQCYKILRLKTSAQWILEGDIKNCFGEINQEWLVENTIMDKLILQKWLSAGYIEQQQLFETTRGTAQGGAISPTLLTITLHGLEAKLKKATKASDKVHLVTYADDFIISGATKEILEQKVKPLVVEFLQQRGLELSKEKTLITHINDGFNFLGVNMRKYKHKLLTKPSKEKVKMFLANITTVINKYKSIPTECLINLLNPKVRGWANYYRHTSAKRTFNKVDSRIFPLIWRWARRRHSKKNAHWIRDKYFCTVNGDRWVFNAGMKLHKGRYSLLRLLKASSVKIVRHIKIRAEANPYNQEYNEYFKLREKPKHVRRKSRLITG